MQYDLTDDIRHTVFIAGRAERSDNFEPRRARVGYHSDSVECITFGFLKETWSGKTYSRIVTKLFFLSLGVGESRGA